MLSIKGAGILGLLDEKNLSADQRRRIVATAAALDLIAIVVSPQSSTHKLSDEMAQLSKYVDAIDAAIQRARP